MTPPTTCVAPALAAATRLIVESRFGDVGMLQRHLRIGYAKAHQLLDAMEAAGIVGPSDGNHPRDVYVADVTEALRRLEATHR